MSTPNIHSPDETLHAVLKCKEKKSSTSNYITMFAEGLDYMYVIKNNLFKSTLHGQKIIFRLSNKLILTKIVYIYIALRFLSQTPMYCDIYISNSYISLKNN